MPINAANQASLARSGQRVSTLVVYLNDVDAGGEITFPEIGFAVSPRKGNAVYFEYCDGAGQLDGRTLHVGCPMQAGEKWVVTKWMRQRRFVPAGGKEVCPVSMSHAPRVVRQPAPAGWCARPAAAAHAACVPWSMPR